MKKKVFTILMISGLMIALAACGGKDKNKKENSEISNDKITIKQYKGLEVEVETYPVTDEDVEQSIQSTLETMATRKEITDRATQNGDEVTLDYEGKLDGEAFDGGTAKGTKITIGNGGYVPGFEEGIVGHKVGETFDVPVTFPEQYAEHLAGKDVIFTMTIHKIEEVTVPELTEELLPKLSETAKTIEDYKKEVRKDLEKSNKETADSSVEGLAWQALMKQCEVKEYPQDQVDEFVNYVETTLAEQAEQQNMTAAEFFEQYYQMTPEEYIKESIKLRYAIELISETEGITLSGQEYEEGLAEMAEEDGYDDVKAYEKQVGRETIELQLLQPKVGEFLAKNCKRVDVKAE